jgi:flagellar export protein FliJ
MTKEKMVSKIIELKEFNKEQLEAEVRKARERFELEQGKLAALEAEYKKTCNDLSAKQLGGTIPVNEVEIFHTYLKHLGKKIEQQKTTAAVYAAELEKIQKAMVTAHKEQRLLEKLHDKITHGQAKDALHGEQKEADYMFLMRKRK